MGGFPFSSPTTSTCRKPSASACASPSAAFPAASRLVELLDWIAVSDAASLRPMCSTECLGCADAKDC
ncbi:hypothetical protein GUJ93_ZPchr0006g41647 [Zizania palustris]|uniref:Uncharacterized protein n=1 Tax=Zizania palustris TaxID=103762 RepID=A0A8J5W4P4_ZIZPA|nr:hypothetical protein GUJ93_ZPchr0006g41647 [Zizania palustris]